MNYHKFLSHSKSSFCLRSVLDRTRRRVNIHGLSTWPNIYILPTAFFHSSASPILTSSSNGNGHGDEEPSSKADRLIKGNSTAAPRAEENSTITEEVEEGEESVLTTPRMAGSSKPSSKVTPAKNGSKFSTTGKLKVSSTSIARKPQSISTKILPSPASKQQQIRAGKSAMTSFALSGPTTSRRSIALKGSEEDRDDGTNRPESPSTYPQVLVLPTTKKPLFPGLSKYLYVTDPEMIRAIQSQIEKNQAYVGIFLRKPGGSPAKPKERQKTRSSGNVTESSEEEGEESIDLVQDIQEVHRVGVFCAITNVYQAGPDNSALSIIVQPIRRIRLQDLVIPALPGSDVSATTKLCVPKTTPETEPKLLDSPESTPAPMDGGIVPAHDIRYAEINRHLANFAVSLGNVENLEAHPYSPENPIIKSLTTEIANVYQEICKISQHHQDAVIRFAMKSGGHIVHDPSKLADFTANLCDFGDKDAFQSVLESLVIEERLAKALVLLKDELANIKMEQSIAEAAQANLKKMTQKMFLNEQLKVINKKLEQTGGGGGNSKEAVIERLKTLAVRYSMPDTIKELFNEEIGKLSMLEPAHSEFNSTRNYCEWLANIPWGKHTSDSYDLAAARSILDEDHHGLKDVKRRILEFIAVGNLRGSVEGKVLCLYGPPGVGKTSIGKSIARALGREFFRFSVGGLEDVAEIKGHRRTYVGALPGKIAHALKKTGSSNPLIMIDEIDKLHKSHRGDPASALLEVLDPEQNGAFVDHYLDVPIDLSKVLFVCTANNIETIPGPLLDRMETIPVSGYVDEEKLAIAQKYLSPVALKESGLKSSEVQISEEALRTLIQFYCRESGVRNLKKLIEKIYRKAAFKIVEQKSDPTHRPHSVVVEVSDLKEFAGYAPYSKEKMYDITPPGVVMGLAWTARGGTPLYIESVLESSLSSGSKPSLSRTGMLGDVMKESSSIAYTYAKSFLATHSQFNNYFDHARIHLHFPEGAIKKDGPSAGVAMTTSLLSLALSKSVTPGLAMTGELTLTGKVLKVGGIKEKVMAAKRSGVTDIILPASNVSEWEELEGYIRSGLTPHFVDWYEQVFELALGPVSRLSVVGGESVSGVTIPSVSRSPVDSPSTAVST